MGVGPRNSPFLSENFGFWQTQMNTFNIKTFGAVGDGVHNDAPAIQAAIDAAARQGGGTVYMPVGRYALHQGLTLASGIALVGAGPWGRGATGRGTTLVLTAPTTTIAMLWGPVGVMFVRLSQFQLDGQKIGQVDGIHLERATQPQLGLWILDNIFVHDCGGNGVYVDANREAIKIVRSQFNSNGLNGVVLNNSDSFVAESEVGLNGGSGIWLGGAVQRAWGNSIYSNSGAGISISGLSIVATNNGIDRNAQEGIKVWPGASNVIIADNMLHTNSQSVNAGYAHIGVEDNTTNISISNNTFWQDPGYATVAAYAVHIHHAATNVSVANNTTTGAAYATAFLEDASGQARYGPNPGTQQTPLSQPGETAGSIYWWQEVAPSGVGKKVWVYLDGYENDTSTANVITFPYAFRFPPVLNNIVGVAGATVSTTALSIDPDTTTTYTGWILVEGV